MSLPEILPPAGTPPFKAEGLALQRKPQDAHWTPAQGTQRKRRVRTSAPNTAQVAWRLTYAQMQAVEHWFEVVLQVGSRAFSAELTSETGAGTQWWRAEWLDMPVFDPRNGYWLCTGTLLLTGDPSDVRPYSPDLYVEFGVALVGTVGLQVGKPLAVEFGAALESRVLLRVEFGAALLPVRSAILREDSGYLLREDGSRVSRELE